MNPGHQLKTQMGVNSLRQAVARQIDTDCRGFSVWLKVLSSSQSYG